MPSQKLKQKETGAYAIKILRLQLILYRNELDCLSMSTTFILV
jgi:hypothetical protein